MIFSRKEKPTVKGKDAEKFIKKAKKVENKLKSKKPK
jgi:hypothetical protein